MGSKSTWCVAVLAVTWVACGPALDPPQGEGAETVRLPIEAAGLPSENPAAQWERPLLDRELPAEIRVWVVQQLAGEAVPEATTLLVRALGEPEIRVVRAVVTALHARGDAAARPALERLRAHPDPEVSRSVGKALEAL